MIEIALPLALLVGVAAYIVYRSRRKDDYLPPPQPPRKDPNDDPRTR